MMNPQRVGNENVVDDIGKATETTLPKAFELKDTAAKGPFPHLFNTVENQHHIGLILDTRYYSPETMRPPEREQFLEWHEDMVRKNIEFDFQWEIVSYCRNDVDILRWACLAFRKIFLDRGKKLGYIVMEKWECFFDRKLQDNQPMRDFLANHSMLETEPLDPREAFFGGYTENIVTRCDIMGTEKLRRRMLLVPVCAKDGLFSARSPGRIRGRRMFCLDCCCETFSQSPCTHDNPAGREFEGTWVSCELRKAIEKGYSIRSVSEIWKYKISQYDPSTLLGGMFAGYINCFLQLKQEASGWLAECTDDEEAKERYLREYEKTEGIVLDRNNIARSNLPNTEVVKTREHFMSLLTSPEHEITNILPVNDKVLYVSWRLRQEALVPSATTSVVIAAYTAQARLKFTGDPNEYKPRTGNFLGDMTNELESYGQGSYIESFVSGGPKFYAYVVRTPQDKIHEVCKVKGITLNFETSKYINFSSIKNLLVTNKIPIDENEEEKKEDARKTSINLRFRAIHRTWFHDIVTRDESKSCVPVLLKRRFDDTGPSVPCGYVVA
ncbi:uncharacterized protein LOC112589711 [Harpegnathos saltator]|uniref:uncharacterized protein LOC112589711 n=1 Tax=Harpegnathos saltator TaxID=610380 RepID=UPI000DBEEFB8|nr:uncharacterized protein LOC112589711 [Harpegnathos saltator]